MTTTITTRFARIETIISARYPGYYAEVWETATERHVFSIGPLRTVTEVINEARTWARANGYEVA